MIHPGDLVTQPDLFECPQDAEVTRVAVRELVHSRETVDLEHARSLTPTVMPSFERERSVARVASHVIPAVPRRLSVCVNPGPRRLSFRTRTVTAKSARSRMRSASARNDTSEPSDAVSSLL